MENRRGHYIPTNAAQFNAFMRRLVDYVEPKVTGTDRE
jgi:hypothetical protein